MGWAWGGGPFAAVSLLEYDGLQPILPFLGGCSDAACRVVIKTAGHGMGMGEGVGGGIFALRRPRPYSTAPTKSATGVCRTFVESPPRGRERLVVSSI